MFNPTHHLTNNTDGITYEIEYGAGVCRYRDIRMPHWVPTTIATHVVRTIASLPSWSMELIEPEFEGN